MKINIYTSVAADHRTVMSKFDQELFEQLTPPGTPMKLTRFDGCEKGDRVELILYGFMQWTSLITETGEDKQGSYFIDEGQILPFPFTYWRHYHGIKSAKDGGTIVSDEIEYKGKWGLGALIYPMLYLQFWYRKSVYRRIFGAALSQ